jgi:protein disulfide-isomerase
MKVDIWSDIMCPFCYIGKRKLEAALEHFEHKDGVEIVWHSFQLDPTVQAKPGADLYSYLAERKGQTRDWSVKMHQQVAQMAQGEGLTYNFDKAVIANSFNAHRLIQLAKKHGLGDAAEEALFEAYFTDGKDVNDNNTLTQLGIEIGLSAIETGEMLNSNAYEAEVNADVQRAQMLGISGVPFFVINDKYGISGAQPKELFSEALNKAWEEQVSAGIVTLNDKNGGTCTDDGCDVA